jgi:hypothetical protein
VGANKQPTSRSGGRVPRQMGLLSRRTKHAEEPSNDSRISRSSERTKGTPALSRAAVLAGLLLALCIVAARFVLIVGAHVQA